MDKNMRQALPSFHGATVYMQQSKMQEKSQNTDERMHGSIESHPVLSSSSRAILSLHAYRRRNAHI